MNRQAYTILATILITASLSFSARAQCSTIHSRADIPFQFSAGEKTLPSGHYTVTCQDSGPGSGIIRLTGAKARVGLAMFSVYGKSADHGKLVFRRHGNRYFLAQVWAAGEETGLQVTKSRAEREAALELAGNQREYEIIALNFER